MDRRIAREASFLWMTIFVLRCFFSTSLAWGKGLGVPIVPEEDGSFRYVDDFSTPRFFRDAVEEDLGPEGWQEGALVNEGPHTRSITYRFHGERGVQAFSVVVDQWANARHLGGVNTLFLSWNGLDWTEVGNSLEQEGDANGWQQEPLTADQDAIEKKRPSSELWVRLILRNRSGLETNASNLIHRMEVSLDLGEALEKTAAGDVELREKWGRMRQRTGHQSLSLHWADPLGNRAPHYYEDADGSVRGPGEEPLLFLDEGEGFTIQRVLLHEARSPLSLVAFVSLQEPCSEWMARIVLRSDKETSRKIRVAVDEKIVGGWDGASAMERETCQFVLLGRGRKGVHKLTLSTEDGGRVQVRELAVAGKGKMAWARKPSLEKGADLRVESAAYLPDPAPPEASQTVEGRQRKRTGLVFHALQKIYEEHEEYGALRLVVRNQGKASCRIENLRLNGAPMEESFVDFEKDPWDARGVVWYRARPRLLNPGDLSQVYVRFRKRPAGTGATLRLETEPQGDLEVKILYETQPVRIAYLTLGEDMRTLYVYVEQGASQAVPIIGGLAWDGERLDTVSTYGETFPGGVCLLAGKLDRPASQGTFHVVSVLLQQGKTISAQFRVLPFFFPRSSIHVPPEMCKEMHMNLAMWHMRPLDVCEDWKLFTTCMSGKLFEAHERVAFVMGPDEPDAHDNRGGGYDKGLGYSARRLCDCGWQELVERYAPQASTWIIMNGTTRPLNWMVYGALADVACFDPYPINFYGADHAYVRESLNLARQCGAPNRMFACLEAFGWQKGQGVPKNARGPIPAEYRQNGVQAIGAGAKGITSWVYSSCAAGWQINQELQEEIAEFNALLSHIEDLLLLGCPSDLATCDADIVPTGTVNEEKWPKERVWAGSLLCGPDAVVLTVANHIPASKPEPPEIQPVRDVTVTVDMPDFLRQVQAYEVTPEGIAPYDAFTVKGNEAQLMIDELYSGRVFLLEKVE